ncbi:fibronectin type III domain protein [Ostertagia ostertagi]
MVGLSTSKFLSISVHLAPLNSCSYFTAPNQVKLTWDRPLHVNGHSNFGGYYVYVEKLLNGEPVNRRRSKYDVINDLSKRYWEIDKLEPNTEYAFRINAFNRNGDGEYTDEAIVTWPGSVTYNVWYKAEGATNHMKKTVNGTANSVELTGLCTVYNDNRIC